MNLRGLPRDLQDASFPRAISFSRRARGADYYAQPGNSYARLLKAQRAAVAKALREQRT